MLNPDACIRLMGSVRRGSISRYASGETIGDGFFNALGLGLKAIEESANAKLDTLVRDISAYQCAYPDCARLHTQFSSRCPDHENVRMATHA